MGVNESTTVAGDTGRVGNNNVGFLSGDFYPAIEFAGVNAVHFIENNFGFCFGEPRVSRHHAAQLSLDSIVTVVKNDASFINIKLGVGIMRDTRGVRGLNIDLWRTVRTVQDSRLLITRRLSVGHNICLRC